MFCCDIFYLNNLDNIISSLLKINFIWYDKFICNFKYIYVNEMSYTYIHIYRANYNLLTYGLPEIWVTYLWFEISFCKCFTGFFFILFDFVFLCFFFFFFVFLDERDIKMEQNYIFRHIFNKTELHNSNWANLRWVKC